MFRFIDKLRRGDIIKLRTRKPDPNLHVHDMQIHTVQVEEVRDDNTYFVRCVDPAHDNLNWVNILTDINVWWDEEPDSIKEDPAHRFKVMQANFLRNDDEKIEFQIEEEEIVHARSFERVLQCFPKGKYGYLLMINRTTKERKIWEYDRGRFVKNSRGLEVVIHRRGAVDGGPTKSVSFTGHRPKSQGVTKLPGGYDNLAHPGRVWLHREIELRLRELAPEKVITGGALGIDQEAFDIAWKLMLEGVIKEVWIYVPCAEQDKKWIDSAKAKYQEQLARAEAMGWVKHISDKPYSSSCMQNRNEAMVNDSDTVIAIWDGSDGGTKNCRDYAAKQNRRIVRINPKDAPAAATKAAKPSKFDDDEEDAPVEVRKSGVVLFRGHVKFGEGPAAAGWVVKDSRGAVLEQFGFSIGRYSIETADFRGLIAGLEAARRHGLTDITVMSSAHKVMRMLESEGCADRELQTPYGNALDALTYFRTVKWVHVDKETPQHIAAEVLALKALNG